MRKTFRNMLLGALTVTLLSSQPMTALAMEFDANHGPGVSKISQEAPGSGGQENTATGPASKPQVPPSSETSGQTPDASSGEQNPSDITQEQPPAQETVPAETEEQKPAFDRTQPYLQIQLLRPDMTWTDPIVDDTVVTPGEGGFLSMSIYTNNLPGDVLYRTYSAPRGWSNWAMNGGHSEWGEGCPIEAVQIRLNGVFGNTYDIYYHAILSDGTVCDWSRNGGTNGAMACGRYITGLRLSMWGKGTEGAAYKMDAPLVAAAADGIQFVNGVPVYSNGTGEPFTGWAWNDRDRYYFVDNNAVVGWQYIGGYKYYFGGDGKLVTDLEPYLNSPGPFLIRINKQMNCTTVYIKDGDNGFIIPYKTFLCSTGDDTPLGDHKTPEKYRWRLMNTDEYCQYCTRLGEGLPILLHSVIYEKANPYTLKPNTYNYLGATPSHGCIRFTTQDAKWIFDHCALGTTVNVYESPVPGPFDRPAIQQMIPETQTWDPTDVNVPENGLR